MTQACGADVLPFLSGIVSMDDAAPVLAFSVQDLAALAAVSCRVWHGAGTLVEETARASATSRVRIWDSTTRAWNIFYPQGTPSSSAERPLDDPTLPRPIFFAPGRD